MIAGIRMRTKLGRRLAPAVLGICLPGCAGPSTAPAPSSAAPAGTPSALAFEPSLPRGLAALRRGDLVAAEGHLVAAMVKQPGDPILLEAIGAVYARTDRPARAEAAFREALGRRPEAPGARLGLATVLIDTGRLDEAAAEIETVLRGDPGNLPAVLKKALLDVRAGRAVAGETGARRVLAAQPDNVEAHYVLGLALERRGALEEAGAAFRAALATAPDHLGALSHLITLAARGGRRAEASRLQADYDAALRRVRVEERVRKHRIAGIEAFNKGDYRAALEAFETIAREDPRDPQVHLHIGSTHLALGDRVAARRALEASLAIDPRGDRALAELGRLLALENRLEEAETALRQAIVVNPEFPEPHYYLAGVLMARGDGAGFRAEMARYEELRARSHGSAMEIVPSQAVRP